MSADDPDQRTWNAALADAQAADAAFDGATAWLDSRSGLHDPIAAEVWAFDPGLDRVLLVQHRWRGWVPPGGKVEPGEVPRSAAARELFEETGLTAELAPRAAAVAVRSFRPGWAPVLSLSYYAVVDRSVQLTPESGQPAQWIRLDEDWVSCFPEDQCRLRQHAARVPRDRAVGW